MTESAGKILKFDSEWFGKRIGRLDIDPVKAAAFGNDNHLDCVYCLVPISDVWRVKEATTQHEFKLVDVRVEFNAEITRIERPEGISRPDDRDQRWIGQLARTAFVNTRFFNDKRFNEALVGDMYANWVREALEHDSVFISGTRDGFVTMDDKGAIGLIAVSGTSRNHGVGKDLMRGAMNHAYVTGLTSMSVVTQGGNIGAQRTFQACGFRTTRTDLWLHKWYS